MPHHQKHDEDFDKYTTSRRAVLRKIASLRGYLAQLNDVVRAMPTTNEAAGYLDLDNVDALNYDLHLIVYALIDEKGFENLRMEQSRLGVNI